MGLYGFKVIIALNIWLNPMKYSSYWDDGVLEFYQLTIHTASFILFTPCGNLVHTNVLSGIVHIHH